MISIERWEMLKRCICTIICSNYISYARTQYESLKKLNLPFDYYVFIVDGEITPKLVDEQFTVIEPTQLFNALEYRRLAFQFNALELSTNVKPTLLKYLLDKGYSEVIYFDPDIYLYSDIGCIFAEFKDASILLTPHSLHPYEDNCTPSDQLLLKGGVFNLGFIGVNNSSAAREFLDWWGARCLELGFLELRSGLMVDQKWVNLVPCYFDGVMIMKNVGYNVAYWNLHERKLSQNNGTWYVNGQQPLVFYHFSGLRWDEHTQISKHQNRYDLNTRPELAPLFDGYREKLIKNGIDKTLKCHYKYDTFDNGESVTDLARKMFYTYGEQVVGDPFCSRNSYYKWLKKNRMVGFSKTNESFNSMNFNANNIRIKIIHTTFKILLMVLGPDAYLSLMKYMGFISIVRNQAYIFKYKGKHN